MASKIQRKYLGYINLKKMHKFFKAIRRIQNIYQCKLEQRKLKIKKTSLRKIQRYFKKKIFKKGINKLFAYVKKTQKSITKISAFYKMRFQKRVFKKHIKLMHVITRIARGYLGRKKFKAFKICRSIYNVIKKINSIYLIFIKILIYIFLNFFYI